MVCQEFPARGLKNAQLAKELFGLEPAAAVSDPPAGYSDGNCCKERPPKGEKQIAEQAEDCEARPEDFLLHLFILVLTAARHARNAHRGDQSAIAISWRLFVSPSVRPSDSWRATLSTLR